MLELRCQQTLHNELERFELGSILTLSVSFSAKIRSILSKISSETVEFGLDLLP